MTLPSNRLFTVVWALAALAPVQAIASEGYFMRAKVIKVRSDGRIDFWVTSVHGMPREEAAPIDTEPQQLPKVIATLELKSPRAVREVSDLLGTRISLRGQCEKLDLVRRVPVIEVRLETGRPWRQASLGVRSRARSEGFQRIAAMVCTPEAASPTDSAPAPG